MQFCKKKQEKVLMSPSWMIFSCYQLCVHFLNPVFKHWVAISLRFPINILPLQLNTHTHTLLSSSACSVPLCSSFSLVLCPFIPSSPQAAGWGGKPSQVLLLDPADAAFVLQAKHPHRLPHCCCCSRRHWLQRCRAAGTLMWNRLDTQLALDNRQKQWLSYVRDKL